MTLRVDTKGIRASIVAAVNGLTATVGGQPVTLSATLDQPSTPDRYQAWPVWVNARPFTQCLSETFWHLVVTLPAADQASTIDAADQLISAVADALFTLGQLTDIRPARLIIGPDDLSVPILQFDITI